MPTNSHKNINVLLVDDHPLARAGIRGLLTEADDMEIIGEAEDGFQAQELVAELRPDVLLLDLKMPGPHPSEVEKWVRENYPQTVTLVLTSHDRDMHLAEMMDAGVSGYLNKDISPERLIDAIRRAVCGDILFDQSQIRRTLNWKKNVGDKIGQLTHQELVVLKLLAEGLDNEDIASRLSISYSTVAFHVANVLRKIQVKSRQKAAVWALKNLSDNLE